MRQFVCTLLLLGVSCTGMAQAVLSPRNMALGGGGSTYITDAHANFYNPANLMIQDRDGNVSLTVGAGSIFIDAMRNYTGLEDQFNNAKSYIDIYSGETQRLGPEERTQLLDDNYPRQNTLSDNRSRYDALLFGLKWMKPNRAYSIALRSRTSSSFRAGKGWYDDAFVQTSNGDLLYDRSLIHRYQSLYELSFGYAESFQFLTGLTPRLDNFIIGIAPKFVIGGDYQNADWENHFTKSGSNAPVTHAQSFNFDASGDFGTSINSYLDGSTATEASNTAFNNNAMNIHGYGAGLDIGITYLLTLGSDLTAVRDDDTPTQRSLRLSFAMTDIGLISYSGDEVSMLSGPDTTYNATPPEQTADVIFTGARGQYARFIEQFGTENPFHTAARKDESFATLLPMALHGGMLLEINRFKLMGDLSIGLTNNAFNSTQIISSAGMEIKPLPFLPLRGGIQFEAQNIDFISVGAAIETKRWELSLAAQFTQYALDQRPTVAGISVAAFQFHF